MIRDKKVTIKDIAIETGLSFTSVSRILNGSMEFPETTTQRVWEATNRLNYIPNKEAQSLRSGKSTGKRQKTGIILHIIHMGEETPVNSEDISKCFTLLSWEAQKRNIFTIPYCYHTLKGFQCPPVLNGFIDGAIVGLPHIEVVETLRQKIPIVARDVSFSPALAGIPLVNIDYRSGIAELFNVIKSLGHKKFGTIYSLYFGDGTLNKEEKMFHLINKNAMECGVELVPECFMTDKINSENNYEKVVQYAKMVEKPIKQKKISLIICQNHYAKILYECFMSMNITIPGDISIVSTYSGFSMPPPYEITSLTHDWNKLITSSLDVLQDLIAQKSSPCQEYLIRPGFYKGKTLGYSNT
ncbi:MAG: LacI family transcriptional regulator [Candidatus Moranbacteria bacterium]|nr:LacI family transcriptional regulator [Candidatus Moranbacteria bacterium]